MGLVDDDVVLHELEEALHVQLRIHSRYPVLLTIVEPDLDPVLALLLQVVLLEVVDDGDVVDEAAIL